MPVQELTTAEFEERTSSGVTLIDFWAPWCGPCRMMTPVIDELDQEMGDKVSFAKVNIDDEPELAGKFQIRSIPAIFIVKDGEIAEQFIGVTSKEDLHAALTEAVGT